MAQTRICQHFQATACPHSSARFVTFTNLPQAVRMRIYDYTFAARLSANSLYKSYAYISIGTVANRLLVNPSFLGLFLDLWGDLRFVSHIVAADAIPWLCMNFMISLERTAVLSLAAAERSPLRKILPYCRRLYFWLREDDKSPIHPWQPGPRESRLSVCELLLVCHHLPRAPLVLGLAGLENEDLAAKALEPLKKLSLSQLGILYYDAWNSNLMKVINSFFMHMIEKELLARGGPLRFLDLPTELRQRVLQFTDLLAPSREVLWKHYRFALPSPRPSYCRDRERKRVFCSRPGLVYPSCACYCFPTSLFLVCRIIGEDARQVFYSSNRFVLVADLPPPSAGDNMTPVTDTRAFLSKALSIHSLHHLRDLEIFFHYRTYSEITEESVTEDSANKLAVIQTVRLIAQHMGGLSLTVQLDPYHDADTHGRDIPVPLATRFAAQARFIVLLQPLRHLASFFVKIGLLDIESSPATERLVHDQEQRLERLVMGETYDAFRHGKNQRRPSCWATVNRY